MNSLARFSRELTQLHGCLDGRDFRRYLGCLASSWQTVLRTRTLAPADSAMTGTVGVTVGGQRFAIPLDAMGQAVASFDTTPTFGSIREIYADNVYLRAFKPGLTADVVVDLGSNRGMFLMLGAKVLGAKLAIGVEPEQRYAPVFAALTAANDEAAMNGGSATGSATRAPRFVRLERFASATPGPTTVTMRDIIATHAISSIGFLKCDIEGGEFDVFLNDPAFLAKVDNIAMELHHTAGEIVRLVDVLTRHGFVIRVTDQFGRKVAAPLGHYLYASRTGALLPAPVNPS